jgi:hypothetical protein
MVFVEFHQVVVVVEGSFITLECATLELTEAEKNAFILFWLDGVA